MISNCALYRKLTLILLVAFGDFDDADISLIEYRSEGFVLADDTANSQDSQGVSQQEIQQAVDALIRRYSLQSVWPSSGENSLKRHLNCLMIEMADLFGRDANDLSLEDLQRAKEKIESLSLGFGVSRLRWGMMKKAMTHYEKASPLWSIVSHTYTFSQLCVGNFGPAVRKYGMNLSGAPLARATGVYLSGQVIAAAYWDEKGFLKQKSKQEEFDPLFDSLDLEALREVCEVMGIDHSLKGPTALRQQIFSQLKQSVHNRIQALWVEQPSYRVILQNLVEELKIEELSLSASIEELEAAVISSVFEQTVEQLSTDSLVEYEDLVKKYSKDDYLLQGLLSSAKAGGLLIGRLNSEKLHLAASTALAMFGKSVNSVGVYAGLGAAMLRFFGPIGIAASTGVLVFQWTKARPRKAIPFVLYMGLKRAALQMDQNQANFAGSTLVSRMKSLYWSVLGLLFPSLFRPLGDELSLGPASGISSDKLGNS